MTKDSLSDWAKYKDSMCHSCKAWCCALPVEVNAEDLIRLGVVTREECEISLKRVSKKLLKEKIIQDFRAKTGLFILSQKPNEDCLFLNSNRQCSVYEKRPEVCRDFPVRIGPKPGFCPYEKKL